MSETLKPCPFCGGKAKLANGKDDRAGVNCTNKDCDASSYYVGVETWNRRHTNAAGERRRTEYTPGGHPITVVDEVPASREGAQRMAKEWDEHVAVAMRWAEGHKTFPESDEAQHALALFAEVRRLAAAAQDARDLLRIARVALNAQRMMLDRGPCPQKFDEAMSWRENDIHARAMVDAAVESIDGLLSAFTVNAASAPPAAPAEPPASDVQVGVVAEWLDRCATNGEEPEPDFADAAKMLRGLAAEVRRLRAAEPQQPVAEVVKNEPGVEVVWYGACPPIGTKLYAGPVSPDPEQPLAGRVRGGRVGRT